MEEFADEIQKLAADVRRKTEPPHDVNDEAATKQSLVLPFIQMLGYDVFERDDVVPEFTADIGVKQGEKVDYALMHDGSPSILVECKKVDSTLGKAEISQLIRYFNVTDAHFGLLTDGLVYRFYSDLKKDNVMDEQPFLAFDVRDFVDAQDAEVLEMLKALTKDDFKIDEARRAARRTKFRTSFKQVLREELSKPSEEFLAFMRSRVNADGQSDLTQDELDSLIRQVCKNFIDKESRMPTEYEPRVPSGEVEYVSPPEPPHSVLPSGERVEEVGGRVVVVKGRVKVGPTARDESLHGKTGTLLHVTAVNVDFGGGLKKTIAPTNLRQEEPSQGVQPSGERVEEVGGRVVVVMGRVVVGPAAVQEWIRGKTGTLLHVTAVMVHLDGERAPRIIAPKSLKNIGR